MTHLEGVVGALPTPFTDSGVADLDAIAQLCDFMVTHCDAVSVLGAAVSEHEMLDPAARRDVLTEGIGLLKGRTTILAGVGSPRPSEVLELAETATAAGADLIQLLIPSRPSGGAPTAAESMTFVEAIAARSPLPVVLYHHPGVGADPAFDVLVELCSVDNVVAIKDSSRDISRNLRAVAEIQQAGHARYLATIQPMLAVMLSGGAGAMTPAGLTLVGAAIRDAVTAGDLAAAGRAQQLIARFPAAWSAYGLLPLSKLMLNALGLPAGDPAPPYPAVPDSVRAELADVIDQWTRELPALTQGDD